MSAASISLVNFGIHSFALALLGWVIVRIVIRDALRRSHAAFLAVLFSLIGAFDIGFWPFPYAAEKAPVWTAVHQTLESNWRVVVTPSVSESPMSPIAVQAPPAWKMDDVIKAARWLYWVIAGVLLLRLLIQSCRMQWWAWRLRYLKQHEIEALPEVAPLGRLRVVESDATPCVAGWFPPVIALPASAFGSLSPQEWRWILRHEAEHLRRADTVAALIQGIIRALLWWNPFVHALIECHARATEEVCDAAALNDVQESEAYSDFLLGWAAKPSFQPACVMPIASSVPARRLKARLIALMEARGVRKRIGAFFVLACLIGVLALPMLVASLGITTAAAQEPVPAKEKADNGELITRIFRVPPEIATQARLAKEWLQQRGVAFPEGALAVANRATSQLIVKNTQTQLDKVAAVVAEASTILPQVYVSGRIIVANQFYGEHGGTLSSQQLRDVLHLVSSTKGLDLMSTPAVTMKLGTQAVMEMLYEGPPGESRKFAGTSIELEVQPKANGRVEATIKPSFGTRHGEIMLNLEDGKNVDWHSVTILGSEARAQVESGETLVAHLPVGKRCVTTLITLRALRPDGQFATGGFGEKINLMAKAQPAPDKSSANNFDAKAKEADKANAAMDANMEAKRVYLSVKVLDAKQPEDVGASFDLLMAGALGTPASGAAPPAPPMGVVKRPDLYTVQGVFTDPQFQVVIRALSQKEGMTMSTLKSASVKSGEFQDFTIPEAHDGGRVIVAPQIGADGSTLELTIRILSASATTASHALRTSITVWDGQTVVVGGLVKEDGTVNHSRLFFITAQIIDPSGKTQDKPASK
ncbi:MAG: M56 family metallopeptidase [Verrucomicrobiota bacterium]